MSTLKRSASGGMEMRRRALTRFLQDWTVGPIIYNSYGPDSIRQRTSSHFPRPRRGGGPKPVVRGTRLSVEFIIGLMAGRVVQVDIIANYPAPDARRSPRARLPCIRA